VTGIQEIAEHTAEIEIDEARLFIEQERACRQHFFEGLGGLLELIQKLGALFLPAIDATATEPAFLVAKEPQLIRRTDVLAPVNVVQLEAGRFDLVFDVTP
jgi:hypothetical protein